MRFLRSRFLKILWDFTRYSEIFWDFWRYFEISGDIVSDIWVWSFFCNRCNSLLSYDGTQLYKSEAEFGAISDSYFSWEKFHDHISSPSALWCWAASMWHPNYIFENSNGNIYIAFFHFQSLKEASDVISESPAALQLRYLQTLTHISAEKNSTIVFPLPIDMMQVFMKK